MFQDLEKRKIESITPYSRNAKKHPEKQIKKIADSIREFGFNQPIVVDKEGVIIVGHGRYEAAKALNLTEVPCLEIDLTNEQANAYRLADNKLNESEWDMELVISELKELSLPLIDLTGFSADLVLEDTSADVARSKLTERFLVPPFSILDTRQGYWRQRKAYWKTLIKDFGESREQTLSGNGMMKNINSGVSILDPVMAELCNLWFGLPQGQTFDCFAGDSVFGYVSSFVGNKFTGIELRPEQAMLNNARVEGMSAKYICDDGQNVSQHLAPESQDLLFSCPPYFDLEVYSDMENDASNQSNYSDFLKILDTAFSNALTCLKQDRFAVIVVGDVRDKSGFYFDFPGDIKHIFAKNQVPLYNELILVEALGTLPQRVSRLMEHRKIGKCHQNVLVFYKGNPKNIKKIYPHIAFKAEDYESDNTSL